MSYNIITTSASNNYKDSGDTNFDGTLWITYIHDVQSCISFIKGILLYLFRLVVSVYCRVCLIFIPLENCGALEIYLKNSSSTQLTDLCLSIISSVHSRK